MSHLRLVASVTSLSLLLAADVVAQDRLFVEIAGHAVEVGAIGRFGQPLGPAPADAFTRVFPRAALFRLVPDGIQETATGELVYSPSAGSTIVSWAATPDASRVYVITWRDPLRSSTLRAIDVPTRAEVAALELASGYLTVTWLPGDRLVIDGFGQPTMAFGRDLHLLALLPMSSYCAPRWFASPHTGRAYLLTASGYSGNSLSGTLVGFDTATGRKVGEANLGRVFTCYGFALWTAPGPPQRLTAEVRRRDVELSWLRTDLAEGYVIDVGFGAGRTDATFFVGTSTGVIFANVPPGVYYVRVRAGNAIGGGRPSSEVRLVVP